MVRLLSDALGLHACSHCGLAFDSSTAAALHEDDCPPPLRPWLNKRLF